MKKFRVRRRSLKIPPSLKRAPGGLLKKVAGDEAVLIGQSREIIALQSLQGNLDELPDWFFSARKGTQKEDLSGIDLVVSTDVGDIPVQIKGTSAAAAEFSWKHPNIAVYIVHRRDMSIVREELIRLLDNERQKILSACTA